MGIVRGNADFSGNKKSVEKFLPVRRKNVSGGKNKVTPVFVWMVMWGCGRI